MKIHHIGYLVENIIDSVKEFEELSYVKSSNGVVYDPERDVNLCFMENGNYQIELVAPKSSDSVVYNMLRKIGNTPYHICYEVKDIDKCIRELRKKGYLPVQLPKEAIGINSRRVAFLVNKNIGMIELLEE